MVAIRRVLAAVVALALLALPGAALAQNTATVTGNVTIRERIALPNNAVVTVQLADVSRAGAAELIAEQTFTTNGRQSPIPFTLTYDPARVNANGLYSVQGNIKIDGRTRYTTTTRYLVITGGRPTNIQVLMSGVGGSLPPTSGGEWLPFAALVLLGAGVSVALVRRRRVALTV